MLLRTPLRRNLRFAIGIAGLIALIVDGGFAALSLIYWLGVIRAGHAIEMPICSITAVRLKFLGVS
jgi:hypothetical protein